MPLQLGSRLARFIMPAVIVLIMSLSTANLQSAHAASIRTQQTVQQHTPSISRLPHTQRSGDQYFVLHPIYHHHCGAVWTNPNGVGLQGPTNGHQYCNEVDWYPPNSNIIQAGWCTVSAYVDITGTANMAYGFWGQYGYVGLGYLNQNTALAYHFDLIPDDVDEAGFVAWAGFSRLEISDDNGETGKIINADDVYLDCSYSAF